MLRHILLLLFAVTIPSFAGAQQSGVQGVWKEPGGSMIRIAPCENDLCATLISIDKQAPSRFDTNNPDPAKRSQLLCGLRIGYGFHRKGPDHADDGRLYDPRSGRTYHGEMTSEGETLHLRGYVGIRLFGRTENWTRVHGQTASCE